MSGKCYACATSFGFLRKEYGCKNCGFAFCKDCLPFKDAVPKYNNEKHKVCRNCHEILLGKRTAADPSKYSPPEAYKKRVAALEERKSGQVKPKPTRPKAKQDPFCKGLSKEDIAIKERLDKLKEDRKKASEHKPAKNEGEAPTNKNDPQQPLPSDDDIAKRLAKLQGLDPAKVTQPPPPFKFDKRSEQEQIDDLLMEISEEVDMEGRHQGATSAGDEISPESHLKGDTSGAVDGKNSDDVSTEEIHSLIKKASAELEIDAEKAVESLKKDKVLWERLNQLKEERKKRQKESGKEEAEPTSNEGEEENEEEQVTEVLKQILAEQRLDEESGADLSNVEDAPDPFIDEDSLEELPWCCICNADAVLRCKGCDGDLYCKRCFREGHDMCDMDHETVPYKKRKS